jgi:hypothetical protein
MLSTGTPLMAQPVWFTQSAIVPDPPFCLALFAAADEHAAHTASVEASNQGYRGTHFACSLNLPFLAGLRDSFER